MRARAARRRPDATARCCRCSASARRRRRQQDGPGRLFGTDLQRRSKPNSAPSRRESGWPTWSRFRFRARTATTSSRRVRTCPGTGVRRCCITSIRRKTTRPACKSSRCECRSSGSFGRRPDFRGFAGTIASGIASVGDRVRVLPSGRETSIARIVTADGDLSRGGGRSIGDVDACRRDRRRSRRCAGSADAPPRSPTSSR